MTARWPALMKRQTAADYCDMSVPSFLKEVLVGRFPASIMAGGREHWRKDALDAAIERLDAAQTETAKGKLKARYGQQAA